jgi:DNA repair protein RadC
MPVKYPIGRSTGPVTNQVLKKRRISMSDSEQPTYIREIELRYKKHEVKAGAPVNEPLTDPRKVYDLFSDMQNEAKEKLITISLDNKLKPLCFEVIAIGSINSVYARPIEALRAAIPLNPYGIILVHNHPSGDPTPSIGDENFTSNLLINTTSLGLEFCDHIIIGHDTYFSFAEQGVMQRLKLKVEKKLR